MTPLFSRRFASLLHALLLAAAAGAVQAQTPPPTPAPPPVEATARVLERRLGQYIAAMRAGDADALAALFVADGSTNHDDLPPIVGRKAIRDFIASFAAFKVLRHEMPILALKLDENLAEQDGSFSQTVRAPDGKTFDVNGSYAILWEHQADDQWRIRQMHTASP